MNDLIINKNGTHVKQEESLKKQTWLKYGWFDDTGIYTGTDYPSNLLIFTPLYGKKLSAPKLLMLIKMWSKKEYEGIFVIEEDLAKAAMLSRPQTSRLIQEMLKEKLICPICNEEFNIIELGEEHHYTKIGPPGHSYILEGIETFLGHVVIEHLKPNPKLFFEYIKTLKTPKKNVNAKSLSNLIKRKKEVVEF